MKTLKNFISKDTQVLSNTQTNQINGGSLIGLENVLEGFVGASNIQEGLVIGEEEESIIIIWP